MKHTKTTLDCTLTALVVALGRFVDPAAKCITITQHLQDGREMAKDIAGDHLAYSKSALEMGIAFGPAPIANAINLQHQKSEEARAQRKTTRERLMEEPLHNAADVQALADELRGAEEDMGESAAAHAALVAVGQCPGPYSQQEATADDAPPQYAAPEAEAWAAGYNAGHAPGNPAPAPSAKTTTLLRDVVNFLCEATVKKDAQPYAATLSRRLAEVIDGPE